MDLLFKICACSNAALRLPADLGGVRRGGSEKTRRSEEPLAPSAIFKPREVGPTIATSRHLDVCATSSVTRTSASHRA